MIYDDWCRNYLNLTLYHFYCRAILSLWFVRKGSRLHRSIFLVSLSTLVIKIVLGAIRFMSLPCNRRFSHNGKWTEANSKLPLLYSYVSTIFRSETVVSVNDRFIPILQLLKWMCLLSVEQILCSRSVFKNNFYLNMWWCVSFSFETNSTDVIIRMRTIIAVWRWKLAF